MKITIISAVSASCGSVFVLQIVCWPFLQRFVCSGADKLSETATSGGNCRRGAHSAMLWNTVQSVEIQCKALKYSTKLWNTTRCVVVSNILFIQCIALKYEVACCSPSATDCLEMQQHCSASVPFVRVNYPKIQNYRVQYLKIQYKCGIK